jgi:hypothetical protein
LSDKLYSARVDECFFFSPAKLRITSDDFVKYLAFSARREKIVITSLGQKIEFARNKRLLSDKLYSARVDVYFFFSPAKLRITFDDFVK